MNILLPGGYEVSPAVAWGVHSKGGALDPAELRIESQGLLPEKHGSYKMMSVILPQDLVAAAKAPQAVMFSVPSKARLATLDNG